MYPARPMRPGPRPARALLVALAAALALPAFAPQDDTVDAEDTGAALESARGALDKWVETRREIAETRREWALGKEILADRISVLRREIEDFQARIAEAEESIARTDEERQELFDENEELKDSSARLAEVVSTLEARTRALLARLPDPIRERVKPLSQRFPEDPEDTKLGLGERFQNIVGVLNEVNKFQQDVTLASEVRALPDGSSVEVTSLYIGVGKGYYANAAGTVAGVGSSDGSTWTWTPANEAAGVIRDAIAILEAEQPAAFVQLPVTIDTEADS